MQTADLENLWRREKWMTIQLQDVARLTTQIAQASDRNDETTVTLLLTLREEPLQRLTEMDQALRQAVLRLPQEDAIRAQELLTGSPPAGDEELALSRQVAEYRNLLQSIQDLDRRISLRMAGKRSFYSTYRE